MKRTSIILAVSMLIATAAHADDKPRPFNNALMAKQEAAKDAAKDAQPYARVVHSDPEASAPQEIKIETTRSWSRSK